MPRMLWMGCAVLAASGCVVHEYRPPPPPPVAYRPPPPPPVPMVEPEVDVAMQIEPPMEQPVAVAIPWAPPPMRWDPPPPAPYVEAVWVGGHWTWWNGEWVWARGHWARPPAASYVYSEPYYEYRGNSVVFVAGFWRPMYRAFVPPPPTMYIPLVEVRVVHVGYARPMGPHGVFVPPPPGSQPGVIVPAPVGTPPAVVLGAPPVVRPGMVVRPPRGGVVEVVAPAGVTREGHPVSAQAPVVSRDAASVHPVVVAPPPPVRATPSPEGYDRGPHGVGPSVAVPALQPARPNLETSSGQPIVQPMLRPEAMGGQRPPPRSIEPSDPGVRDGPILRPIPPSHADVAPRPPPVRTDAQGARPPVAAAPRAEAPPARARPVPQRSEGEKPRPEPKDR